MLHRFSWSDVQPAKVPVARAIQLPEAVQKQDLVHWIQCVDSQPPPHLHQLSGKMDAPRGVQYPITMIGVVRSQGLKILVAIEIVVEL